jgi:hypothetical protein
MGKVTALTPREVVRQDVEAIAAIYRNLGAPTAEKMVTRALGELALTMARLAETVRAQNLRDMADHLVRNLAGWPTILALSALQKLPAIPGFAWNVPTAPAFRQSGPGWFVWPNDLCHRILGWPTCPGRISGWSRTFNKRRLYSLRRISIQGLAQRCGLLDSLQPNPGIGCKAPANARKRLASKKKRHSLQPYPDTLGP